MDEKKRAEENLAIIRSMMERATVYRMISGPTALFAGFLTLIVPWISPLFSGMTRYSEWKWAWFGVAVIVMMFNTILVVVKAKREEKSVFSPGLRMGIWAIFPSLLIGFVIGLLQPEGYHPVILAWIWMLCYGVALMATRSFAPRSISWLGFAFILAGLYHFIKWPSFALGVSQRGWAEVRSLPSFQGLISVPESVSFANQAMMFSFGALHLIYGCYVIFIETKRS